MVNGNIQAKHKDITTFDNSLLFTESIQKYYTILPR